MQNSVNADIGISLRRFWRIEMGSEMNVGGKNLGWNEFGVE